MTILDSVWFTHGGKCVGIVLVIDDSMRQLGCFIGSADGANEDAPARVIAQCGVRFPMSAARALFPDTFRRIDEERERLIKPWVSLEVPWPKPKSAYDTDGPDNPICFVIRGHLFSVVPTRFSGSTTGRTCFDVGCKTCDTRLHERTTSPRHYIENHIREKGA